MTPTWLDTYGLTGQLRADKRWAEASRPGIRYVALPKATVRVRAVAARRSGMGKTVVFATDPPCCIEHFDALFDKLSADYSVVCFEAPGFGFTRPNRHFRFTPDDYAEVLTGLLRTLDLAPYILAFECVSAYSALMVAAREPKLVERVVVMQAPVWSEEQRWMRRLDAVTQPALVIWGNTDRSHAKTDKRSTLL